MYKQYVDMVKGNAKLVEHYVVFKNEMVNKRFIISYKTYLNIKKNNTYHLEDIDFILLFDYQDYEWKYIETNNVKEVMCFVPKEYVDA